VCFGVRDRRSGRWLESHWALERRLATAFPDGNGKMCCISSPNIGEPLCFCIDDRLHQTSPVLAVEERAHLDLGGSFHRISPALRAAVAQRPQDATHESY
jgi:hypothetical protein